LILTIGGNIITIYGKNRERKMHKKISSVDLETGEILDYALVAVQKKRRNDFRRWAAMDLDAIDEVSESDFLRGDDFRVLLKLIARLDFENLINIVQADIAKQLKMQPSHVNRSIKRLIEIGIILEGPKIGRSRTYRLNPNYAWRGSAKNHKAAKDAHRKAELAGLQIIEGGRSNSSGK